MKSTKTFEYGVAKPMYSDDYPEGVTVIYHGDRNMIARKTGPAVVSTCEVVLFDAPGPMTPFERTQAEYEGVDGRQLPTVGFDDDLSDLRLDWV